MEKEITTPNFPKWIKAKKKKPEEDNHDKFSQILCSFTGWTLDEHMADELITTIAPLLILQGKYRIIKNGKRK